MAGRVMEISLALALMATLWVHASAQSSGCTPVIVSLTPCLSYITGNSSTPSASCCSQLSTVVQTQAQCLCMLLNGGNPLGLPINQTVALTLPGACNVQTPPLSQCNATAAAGPAIAPALAPSATSSSTPSVPSNTAPGTPSTPSVPSSNAPAASSVPSGGSKTVPGTSQSSDGSSIGSTNAMVLAFFLIAASIYSLTSSI